MAHKLEKVEVEEKARRLREAPHVLHPAGGLTEDFVYEPIAIRQYVYRTKEGKKGIVEVQKEYEDEENQRRPHWSLEIEGNRIYFIKKPPKEWLFNMPDRVVVENWVSGEKQSLPTNRLWNLNSIFLRTFLDFPHSHEFSATLVFVKQTWLAEILPVVFYLGIKGEFGGGKTVTGEAIYSICRHGYLTGNLSPPFVARTIQDQKLTLMVDELDSVAGTKDSDLNSIFRQGYRRGAKYSRVNPDTLEPESYGIFGPKLFTIHSESEEALQTRTVPIHVRETSRKEYPIANLDKDAFSRKVYTENFLWYLDNILDFKTTGFEKIQDLTNQLDILDGLEGEISEGLLVDLDKTSEKIRQNIFKKKSGVLTEAQVNQVSQVAGRNVELMFLCLAISNIVGINVDDDIKKTFDQKIVEEGERTEIGYLGALKDVLTSLFNEKKGSAEYQTESKEVKISNKEIYDSYNERLKKEYGQGVSPTKFKEFMLEFGFTDALNRKKLEVPIPDDPKPKSRLCNIFNARVLKKLGIEETKQTFDLKNIVEIIALEKPEEGKCGGCKQNKVLYHQAKTFQGEWSLFCQDCGAKIQEALGKGVE